MPVWRSRSLVRQTPDGWAPAYVGATHVVVASLPLADLVMLGRFGGRVYFAADVPGLANRSAG